MHVSDVSASGCPSTPDAGRIRQPLRGIGILPMVFGRGAWMLGTRRIASFPGQKRTGPNLSPPARSRTPFRDGGGVAQTGRGTVPVFESSGTSPPRGGICGETFLSLDCSRLSDSIAEGKELRFSY